MNHWSIRNRILFMALMPGIMVSLVLGIFFIANRSGDLKDLVEQRALAMAKQLAPTCEYGVMTGSIGILQNIANNMLEERDVRAINLYDQEMNILAHAGPRMLTERVSATSLQGNQLQLVRTAESVRVKAPIFAQNLVIADQLEERFYAQPQTESESQLLGWAEVELSYANTRLQQYQNFVSSIAIIILVLLIGSFFSIRISRNISDPVRDIRNALYDIRSGKLDTRIHVNARGELQDLAAGVNAMAAAMQRENIEHQQALEQSSRESQETIDELEIRNHELMIGNRQAEEASRTKSEFLANVSHEIRTPLNGIIGFSDLLARTQVSERQHEYVDTIRQSSEDLLNIINDILDLSKIDAGKLILENNSFELRDLIEEALQVLSPQANEKGIEICQYISPELPDFILGDRLRLKQVLTNLCSNAVKFTPDGGVSVRVHPLRRDKGHVSIQFDVTDTGIGMSEKQQARLFQAFSQADPGIARQYGGTGLGLIISRALIEAMGGDINVQSREGHGSTFSFSIDVEVDEEHLFQTEILAGIKVATIDTTEEPATDTLELLEKRGAELTPYSSITEFFSYQDERPCDLAIIFTEREVLGYQYVKDWFDLCAEKSIPVLAISRNSLTDNEDKPAGIPTLSNPFTQQQLTRNLLQLAGRPTSTDESEEIQKIQRTPNILAVDDNEANLKLVVTLLKELGVNVQQAPSGYEAVALVGREDLDLVLMDIQMPGMSGTEATARIRKLPGQAGLPVVALTAHAMSDERQALIAAGFNDYQTKPVSLEQLARIIERWTGFNAQQNKETENNSDNDVLNEIFSSTLALHHANRNTDLAIDMFSMLRKSLADEKEHLIELWENEALDELLEVVHKLHGAARYCGVPLLRNALDHFETSLKANRVNEFPGAMRQLITAISDLQEWTEENDWERQLQDASTANA